MVTCSCVFLIVSLHVLSFYSFLSFFFTGVISPLLHFLAPDYHSGHAANAANAAKEEAAWKGDMSPEDVAVNASYALVNLSLLPANQVSSL